ncbi:MAG: aminotransferase class V-fold PLP-dependent enzyme [Oscillatoria sp. PMC 1051.18]|nr:aminotransferase class V-fold PLP-dependent enzyme [Oscillatoria sp. PMC 1050.18]MEC5031111.1 aminotransferase class V-fold PLP-dependent enzyme [Oscillatoria sp. PMC 1051.18]NET88191.1 aminotransferase class V-fold PLP-dependent enzyme [Kamptonema sp. SIO1D9]
MSTAIYLNTARLGLMLPRVQRLYGDFLKFTGDEVSSLYFDKFIYFGFESLPNKIQKIYPFLSDWKGISNFKKSLKSILSVPLYATTDAKILLANRSCQLMKLGANLLFLKSQKVLTTDLEWPQYKAILKQQKEFLGGKIKTVDLRSFILEDNCTREDLISRVISAYDKYDCDGLFISHITFEGFRLPVEDIVKIITSQKKKPSFVVVDGSQSFSHSPLNILEYSDFYITGCHKWLRAWHPMGLAFCSQSNSVEFITTIYRQMLEKGKLDDPLLNFTNQLELGSNSAFTETVNLNSLFSAAAAVANILEGNQSMEQKFKKLVEQVEKLEAVSINYHWTPLVKNDSLKSGIGLIKSTKPSIRALTPKQLRASFQSHGIDLTAYGKGIIRISAPIKELDINDYQLFHKALDFCHS